MTDHPFQAVDTRNLLDVVDKLRSQGVTRYIDLPQIIVCGDQSSGKSSVLEAISGLKFPRQNNLCTGFATELILRRGPVAPVEIRILPNNNEWRSKDGLAKVLEFNERKLPDTVQDLDLEQVIKSAKQAMDINNMTKAFSSDILRLELCGPNHPHLTLVDLPGLFHTGSRGQSDTDGESIRTLVQNYMRNKRSIILPVVSAKNDFANQIITRYCREIDSEGDRTLGLITKPDTLDKGPESERRTKPSSFVSDGMFFATETLHRETQLWRSATMTEEQFFASGIWNSLEPTQLRVHHLKSRLSKILKDQILVQLPDVLIQVQSGIVDCERQLEMRGCQELLRKSSKSISSM